MDKRTVTAMRMVPRPKILEIIRTLKTGTWRLLRPSKKSATPHPIQAVSDKLNAIKACLPAYGFWKWIGPCATASRSRGSIVDVAPY
jgi:hypothetical protein